MRSRRGGASGSRFAAHKSRVISVSVHTATRGPMASGGGPSYNVTFSTAPVAEGDAITFTILANGVPNNTVMYWKNTGTTTAADFVENVNEGYVTIRAGRGSFTLTTKADFSEEGNETVRIEFFTHNPVANTGVFTLPDTSRMPTYAISSPNVSSESDVLVFNIATTDVSNGTVLYWKNIGTTTAADFIQNVNQGTVTINNNAAVLTLSLSPDLSPEGQETLRIQLYTDEAMTNAVATSGLLTVPDTSSFVPSDLTGLTLWVDANDPNANGTSLSNGAYVSTWYDKSGNGSNLIGNVGYQGGSTYVSAEPAVNIPRTEEYFFFPSTVPSSNYDCYIVGKPTKTVGFASLFMASPYNLLVVGLTATGPVYRMANLKYNTNGTSAPGGGDYKIADGTRLTIPSARTLLSFRNDASNNTSLSANGGELSQAGIGAKLAFLGNRPNTNEPWGLVHELVMYSSNLSTADRQKVEGYLARKWGIQNNLASNHPYI
jgi:hypothetical protein